MKQQKGFTLIELVIVIVILGILAVMIIPKYIDLKSDARSAALEGIGGSLASASAINYAQRSANPKTKGTHVDSCDDLVALIHNMPAGYSVNSTTLPDGGTGTCIVTWTADGQSASFSAIGIS